MAKIGHFSSILPDRPARALHYPAAAPVTIAMATCNGAAYLGEQLDSLSGQTCPNWVLWVSDDGSTDATMALLRDFDSKVPVTLTTGPQRGAAANFLHLLNHRDLPDAPIALCDQDDVWLPHKLSRALSALAKVPADRPALYAAASIVTDAALRPLGRTRRPRLAPSFGNALVENLCSGHTLVLNRAALALVRRIGPVPGVRYHDWWLYQLVTGAGGTIILDDAAVALYRQHDGNAVGAHRGLRAACQRAQRLASGDWGRTIAAHANALSLVATSLTPAAQSTLLAYHSGLPPSGRDRMRGFRDLGLTRSTRSEATAVAFSAWCGWV